MMKSSAVTSKGKAVFELKHRLVQAVNKIADRDTYQIGLDELEKMADTLTPDMIGPFLSCVIDTDAEQKSAVRKECIKVIGTLARLHGNLLAPHMAKMVSSVVKRLKDTDSVVRDACVDTCGTLAMCARNYGDGGAALVALVRPLFESLGEQNRYVQAGAALCLAKVIDESNYFPGPVLPQMLVRVVKLLKNPHFMAKPAAIELIRSIIQAEGASTEQALSSALTSIMDALKSSDWNTRKAASLALSSIAVSSGYLVASFRTFCLRSLERSKFDKVKPVRDAIIHAIQLWKAIPGSHTPEPSEAGSSTKENFFGDHHDARGIHDGGSRDTSFRRTDHGPSVSVISGSSINSAKRRSPLSINKIALNNTAKVHHLKSGDWRVEVSVPKQNMMPLADTDEKGCSKVCILKDAKRNTYEIIDEGSKFDYDIEDDKQECSSVSEVASRSCETKHVTTAQECIEDCESTQVAERCPRGRESKSIDSTVTDVTAHGTHSCCLNAMNELALIRKQLQEMERKQATLFDLLQEFMSNSVENMSVLNLKVHNLENAVDKTVYTITQSESRSSVDANYKPPPISHLKNEKKWMHDLPSKGSNMCTKEGAEFPKDHSRSRFRKPGPVSSDSNLGRYGPSSVRSQASMVKGTLPVSFTSSCEQPEMQNALCASNQSGEFQGTGDIEAAYMEALNCGDYDDLIDLMDRTGPVLEKLSCETANELLRVITGQFLNKKFFDFALPWLQQLADLSMIYKPTQLFASVRAQKEFLSALEEAATSGSTEPAIRIAIAQLAFKLTKAFEVGPCRKISARVCRGNETIMATAM
ncbi:TORTIFOLIA1-like protein 2 isoform X2 [Panicum virgatum]|uniref:TORTIFOLIA1-like protein 2 isoform X2 n=1 Tax=Panicum virgatum TaxID=38727 RepID=UPI0019D5E751|nr:TORTIFOLIA1-like protein 2 isoform X2 [Panicum virgatum]